MPTTSATPGVEVSPTYQPSLRDMVMLEIPYEVRVSPGGTRVAVTVRRTDWKENRYENVCYVHDVETGAAFLLSRTGSVNQVEWLDDDSLAVLRQGQGADDKAQVWLYEGLVGDGWQITEHKTGVEWFKPFSGGVLYRARQPERDERKARSDRFGKFSHFEQEDSTSALYYCGLTELRQYQANRRAATEDEAKKLVQPVIELSRLMAEPLSIQKVVPSPLGDALYLNCWRREDLVYYRDTSTYRMELDASAALAEHLAREQAKLDATHTNQKPEVTEENQSEDLSYLGEISQLHLPRGAFVTAVSPDGSKLLVVHQGRDDKMYTQQNLWVIDLSAACEAADETAFRTGMHNISATLDRQILESHWVRSGIYASYADGCRLCMARLAENAPAEPLDFQGVFPLLGFHVSETGRVSLVGTSAVSFPEAYVADSTATGDEAENRSAWSVKKLTDFGRAVEDWDLGTVDTIRWTSRDGTEIEGVLRKPSDFDPAKSYPLVFVVHGGPLWFSADYLVSGEDRSYYPSVQFAHKGILVLKPNYRGSLGRGQAFADLNVDNLGVGDLWDLESAIEHLVERGWVDAERVGCMGWSQGGYISAFAGLHSDRFKAVSVGAGVSDWYTYHISNDIPQFTVDYLSGSPFRDRGAYIRTAPISNLANATTPMLIQHGSDDRRVPLSNALELYRGLQEMGVPAELFIFPGMGHPITRPRENHAVMHQNLAWFSHYLLGEELELE